MSTTTFQNAVATVENNQLVLRVDLSNSIGASKSGKSHVIATSGGNKPLAGTDDMRIGFTVYRPRP